MLRAAVAFFILAILAYVFGAYGIAGLSVEIGQILLWVFIIFALLSFAGSYLTGNRPKKL